MTIIRFVYKSLWRSGEIIAQSSENAQFPADNTQDDCKELVWRSNGLGAEKMVDGGLEIWASATNLTNWTEAIAGTSTVNREAVTIHGGTYSCRFDVDGSASNAQISQTITLTANGSYRLSFWYKAPVGYNVSWQLKDAAGNVYLTSAGAWTAGATYNNAAGTGDWAEKALNFIAHNSYTSYILALIRGAASASQSLYVDDVSIYPLQYIDCDFGAADEYDSVSILRHNFTSSAIVTVHGADDATFLTNKVSDVLTYNGNNIFEFLATARTKRYCRLSVHDIANPSAYIQIGVIVVGKYFQPNRNFTKYSEGEVDETEMEKSPSMNLFTVQERPKIITWELPFEGLDITSTATIRLMRANNGVSKALEF